MGLVRRVRTNENESSHDIRSLIGTRLMVLELDIRIEKKTILNESGYFSK